MLWRSVGKVDEESNVKQEPNNEGVLPLIDVIDALNNGAREHEQNKFEAGIKFRAWSSEGDVFNLHTREVLEQGMNEVQPAIA